MYNFTAFMRAPHALIYAPQSRKLEFNGYQFCVDRFMFKLQNEEIDKFVINN